MDAPKPGQGPANTAPVDGAPRFVDLALPATPSCGPVQGRPAHTVRIEVQWHRPARRERPLVVFLHEGLGSVAMWRGFPAALCAAADLRGLVYSRPGYGRSTPHAANGRWPVNYLHTEADTVLPALLAALGIDEAPWLLGHSDGASIALIRAANAPDAVSGCIVLAPHLMVEDFCLDGVRATRRSWQETDLRQRLARHHADVDSVFLGWNDVWLSPAFRSWSIEPLLPAIRCPLLAIQGADDEYGTLAHLDSLVDRVPGTRALVLPGCGHSPHQSAADAVIAAVADFIAGRTA